MLKVACCWVLFVRSFVSVGAFSPQYGLLGNSSLRSQWSLFVSSSNKIEIPGITSSAELITLLREKNEISKNKIKIDQAIESLANLNVQFDPSVCLNGPFYASIYQQVRCIFVLSFNL